MSLTPNYRRDRERCVWETYLFHNLETSFNGNLDVQCWLSSHHQRHCRSHTCPYPGHHLSSHTTAKLALEENGIGRNKGIAIKKKNIQPFLNVTIPEF